MGPQVILLLPFVIYAVIVTFALWAIINFVIAPHMYTGPEDEESWNPEDHFIVKSDDPNARDYETFD